jgi:mRNA-degrading endonuclease toxin of MazEF toxin-antitoxin module
MFEHGHAQSRRQIALFPFAGYRANERRERERRRSTAISSSACQNGSSRVTLVVCPATTTVRLRIGEVTIPPFS